MLYVETGAQVTALLITRSEIDSVYEGVEKATAARYSNLRAVVLQQSINK
jgi:hypothetical protein